MNLPTTAIVTLAFALLPFAALAGAPGDLDPSFGMGGLVTGPRGDDSGAAIQADGKIVVALEDFYTFKVLRYEADGALDQTFGTGGEVVVSFAPDDRAAATSAAIEFGGKIILGGWHEEPTGDPYFPFWPREVVLVRLLPDGSFDSTFGVGGIVGSSVIGAVYDIELLADGRIVTLGTGVGGYVFRRYLNDGSVDVTFGDAGVSAIAGSGGHSLSRMQLQADGKLVAVGKLRRPGNDDFFIARHLTDGGADLSFGNAGSVETDFGFNGSDSALAVVVQPDQKLLVVGFASGQGGMVRYLPDGTLDLDFGTAGLLRTQLFLVGFAVVLKGDGRFVVAGTLWDNTHYDFAVARFLADGSPDLTFGIGGGIFTPDSPNSEYPSDVFLHPPGKILVVGNSSNDVRLARYLGEAEAPPMIPSLSLVGLLTLAALIALAAFAQNRSADPRSRSTWYGTKNPRPDKPSDA
jgi:uncharacterized delta-60 repeat protein